MISLFFWFGSWIWVWDFFFSWDKIFILVNKEFVVVKIIFSYFICMWFFFFWGGGGDLKFKGIILRFRRGNIFYWSLFFKIKFII